MDGFLVPNVFASFFGHTIQFSKCFNYGSPDFVRGGGWNFGAVSGLADVLFPDRCYDDSGPDDSVDEQEVFNVMKHIRYLVYREGDW